MLLADTAGLRFLRGILNPFIGRGLLRHAVQQPSYVLGIGSDPALVGS